MQLNKDEFLKKFSTLRAKYLDNDSITWIDEAEAEIRNLFEESALSENPVFIRIAKDAQQRLGEIDFLLVENEELTDLERKSLFREKRVWAFIFERFGMRPQEMALATLNDRIDIEIAK